MKRIDPEAPVRAADECQTQLRRKAQKLVQSANRRVRTLRERMRAFEASGRRGDVS